MRPLRKSSVLVATVVAATAFAMLAGWLTSAGLAVPPGLPHAVVAGTFAFNWSLSPARIRIPRSYGMALLALAVYLFADTLLGQHAAGTYALGALLTFTFVLLFLCGLHTKAHGRALERMLQLLTFLICALALGTLLRPLLSGAFVRDTPPLFRELGAMGTACNVAAVTALVMSVSSRRRYFYLTLACLLSLAVVLTTLKKSIVCNGIVWLLFLFGAPTVSRRVKTYALVGMLSASALGLATSWDELRANLAITTQAIEARNMEALVRPALYVAAFDVARDHFPFGSGLGTFASVASMWRGYSELYYTYGLASMGPFSPELAAQGLSYLFDSCWAHVLAELGFLGSCIYFVLWFLPASYAVKALRDRPDPASQGLLLYVVGVCVVMTVEGIATYNPEIVSFAVFHSAIAGLVIRNVAWEARAARVRRGADPAAWGPESQTAARSEDRTVSAGKG